MVIVTFVTELLEPIVTYEHNYHLYEWVLGVFHHCNHVTPDTAGCRPPEWKILHDSTHHLQPAKLPHKLHKGIGQIRGKIAEPLLLKTQSPLMKANKKSTRNNLMQPSKR